MVMNNRSSRWLLLALVSAAVSGFAGWTSAASADCKDVTLAGISAAVSSLEANPTQALTVNAVGFANSGEMNANPHVEMKGSGDAHIGEITGFKSGAVTIDSTQAASVQAEAKAQTTQTVQVLNELKAAVEGGDKTKAEGLLTQLTGPTLDVVKQVVTAAVLKWLKLG